MTCAQVRQLLGAYRRDDWSQDELAGLSQHLSACVECRQIEASYRGVGESIRQLPSISPPPEFRASVFAAIRAEQEKGRLKPSIARLASEDTAPSMPVVRPTPIRRPQRRQLSAGMRAAMAIAAVLVLALAVVQLTPLSGVYSQIASNLGAAHTGSPTSAVPTIARYMPDAHYQQVTSALASGAWLAYTALDATGGAMLFSQNRRGRAAQPLLASAAHTPIMLRALTQNWVIWNTGDGRSAWTLFASKLTDGAGAPPVTLAAANAGASLMDVWAQENTVLVATASSASVGELDLFDLSQAHPASHVLAHAHAAGHVMADISSDGGVYYWADIWKDGSGNWHSMPWRSDADGQNDQPMLNDDRAFDPQVGAGTLAWVEVPASGTGAAADLSQSERVIDAFSGAVMTRDLISGRQRQVGQQAQAGSLHAHGRMLIWRTGSQMHTYDLRLGKPSSVDSQVSGSNWAELNEDTITWGGGKSSPIYVYDLD